MANLYVYEQGATIEYKDNNLVVISNKQRIIPIDKLDRIILFGEIGITTLCIQFLLKKGIPVTFLSKNGNYFGSLEATNHIDTKRQRLQFQRSDDAKFCLGMSKIFIKGKIKNQRTLLFDMNKKAMEPLAAISAVRIREQIEKVDNAKNIEDLNPIISKMNELYFSALSSFLGDDFNFTKRIKMPPKDPFNSILSFGYTLLLYEIQNIVLSKGLNPYIGFFTPDELNMPALCSDLIEEWRTILVDSLAFKLLWSKKLNLDNFKTIEETGAVLLKKEAAYIFIEEFEKKLKSECGKIIGDSHKISYRRAIEYQIVKLINAIENDRPEEYTPFELENN